MACRFFYHESQRQSLELERGAHLLSNRLHIYFLPLPLCGYHKKQLSKFENNPTRQGNSGNHSIRSAKREIVGKGEERKGGIRMRARETRKRLDLVVGNEAGRLLLFDLQDPHLQLPFSWKYI